MKNFNIREIEIENPDWVKMLYHSKDDREKTEVIELVCKEVKSFVNEIKQLVIEDVPHQYQERLLQALVQLDK